MTVNFELPAEIYVRLAKLPRLAKREMGAETFNDIQCVRLEHNNRKSFALSTSRKIAAIFFLGETDQPDGAAHVTIDDNLIRQCETEKVYNSTLFVASIPEIKVGTAKTTMGYNFPGNAVLYPDVTVMADWRKWFPQQAISNSYGAMHWNTDDMVALNASSPSGNVSFPPFIDARQPVCLRDPENDNWCGLFMPNLVNDNGSVYEVKPAEIPDWLKA